MKLPSTILPPSVSAPPQSNIPKDSISTLSPLSHLPFSHLPTLIWLLSRYPLKGLLPRSPGISSELNPIDGVLPSSVLPPSITKHSCSFTNTWNLLSGILWPLYFQFSLLQHQLFHRSSFVRPLSVAVPQDLTPGPLLFFTLTLMTCMSNIYVHICVGVCISLYIHTHIHKHSLLELSVSQNK